MTARDKTAWRGAESLSRGGDLSSRQSTSQSRTRGSATISQAFGDADHEVARDEQEPRLLGRFRGQCDALWSRRAVTGRRDELVRERVLKLRCEHVRVPTRFGCAILFVSDLDRAIAFYRDVIGLPLRFRADAYAEFATEGAKFALFPGGELPALIGRHAPPDRAPWSQGRGRVLRRGRRRGACAAASGGRLCARSADRPAVGRADVARRRPGRECGGAHASETICVS